MAGHRAATAAPTWPSINGQWIPERLFAPAVNLVENKITVHFIHRGLAYLLLLFTIGFTIQAARSRISTTAFIKTNKLPLILITMQVLLGIATVVTSTRHRTQSLGVVRLDSTAAPGDCIAVSAEHGLDAVYHTSAHYRGLTKYKDSANS